MTRKILTRIGLATLFIATGLVGGIMWTGSAQANREDGRHGGFSNRDFRGAYGMLELGQVEGQTFLEIARVVSDGNGRVAIEAIGNIGGQTGFTSTLSCTYEVRNTGMGRMSCKDDNSGEVTDADFVLSDGGREVKIITTPNPHGYTYSTARRQ
jgi:hypothetical protein